MQQDDILCWVRKWCYNLRRSRQVIYRMRGREKYQNGNSFFRRREEVFYSSLVNKSPGTSSSVASFPSSPSSQSEEDSGTTGRTARDSTANLDPRGTLLCDSRPGFTSNVGNNNGH